MTSSSGSETSIAYGRALLELGLAPPDAVRALGQHCLQHGRDLRAELLARGVIGPAQDAQVLALIRGRTAADPREARPPSGGPPGSKSDTRGSALLPGGQELPRPGQVFAGCRIEREIARGGMGAVFAATGPDGSPVAVKVILGDLSQGARRGRFEREAEIGENLRHPGIVRQFSHGEEGGLAFMVMELLDGACPLDEWIAREHTPVGERLRLFVEVCQAVGAAHQAGIVHRDLKPDNVLVTRDGQPKVVDFGLARQVDRDRLTQSGAVMGTLHYMAPEQVSGQTAHADARADVFALGVMLYELLTGALPFTGETGVEVMRKILEEEPPPLPDDGSLPPGLDAAIAMAMAKAPADRYPDAAALARELVSVASGSGVSAAALRLQRRGRSKRRLVIALALAALAGLGTWLALRPPPPPSAAELEERADALGREAWELLTRPGPLAAEAAAVEALLAQAQELAADRARAEAAGETVPAGDLDAAADRARAVAGLLALARGDFAAAQQTAAELRTDGPAPSALRGAVAAVDSAGSPSDALRHLERAAARGAARRELLAWRVEARVRAGLSTRTDAEQALAELDQLAGGANDVNALPAAVRSLRVEVLLALERPDEAQAALEQLADAPLALRWRVGLRRAKLALGPAIETARAALSGLPAPGALLAAERAKLAEQALAEARPLVTGLKGRQLTPPRALHLLAIARLVRPEAPLPPDVVAPLVKHVSGVTGFGDSKAALALAELCPDDYEVQRTVGLMSQQSVPPDVRRRMLECCYRAVELTDDPREKRELEYGMCQVAAMLGDLPACAALAERLLPQLDDSQQRAAVYAARATAALRARTQFENALADVNEALALHDLGLEFRPIKVSLLVALKRDEAYDEVVDWFRFSAGKDSPDLPEMTTVIWKGFRADEVSREAIYDALSKACPWRPAWWHWRIRLSWLALEHTGDPARARAPLLEAIALLQEGTGPAKHLPVLTQAEAALSAGDGEGALALLAPLVDALD